MEVAIRPVIGRDTSGLMTLEEAMVKDGRGMALGLNDIPKTEAAMRRTILPWLRETPNTRLNPGLFLVAAPTRPSGTIPILATGELRRLQPERVHHVAVLALSVHPDFRRRGLGKALMETLLAWAWTHHIARVELYVRADNPEAQTLYRQFGFQEEGRRRAFIQLKKNVFVDDIIMGRLHPAQPLPRPQH